MKCAGLDIGGANIKFASTDGQTKQISFPFWKDKNRLPEVLDQLKSLIGTEGPVGVTMTAELADCFEDKKTGVTFIVNAVESTFNHQPPQQRPLYYRTDGSMCDAGIAIKDWHLIAASNWHATAWLAFQDAENSSGYVFDIGSTTTDIIPVESGFPIIGKQDDLMRLSNGQLFYGGIGRTPVCGLIDRVETESGAISTANEFFATTRDVFTWRNELPPDENNFDSADGRSNSRANAGKRLARMVCADLNSIDDCLVDLIAAQAKQALVARITSSLSQVAQANPDTPLSFVTFGSGAWLAEEIIERQFAGVARAELQRSPAQTRSFSDNVLVNQTAAALAVAKKRQLIFQQSLGSNE